MRVAYVIPFDVSRMVGALDRLRDRLWHLKVNGIDIELFVATGRGTSRAAWAETFPCPVHLVSGRSSATATWHLSGAVRDGAFDLAYVRYGLPYPGVIRLARSIATVLEIHADDLRESRHRPWYYFTLAKAAGGHLFSTVRGAVFVDPDLLGAPRFKRLTGPRTVIPNGIQLRPDLDYGGPRDRKSGPPRLLLAAGADEPWQGLDKYLDFAAACPELEFHVAGPKIPLSHAMNVAFHGPLSQTEFEALLARVDIGVGNLALERVGRRRPSPLKVREYIRHGLPCVIAHDDPDLGDDPQVCQLGYGFQVDQSKAQLLVDFADRATGRTISQSVAQRVRVESKEEQRAAFLHECVPDPRC